MMIVTKELPDQKNIKKAEDKASDNMLLKISSALSTVADSRQYCKLMLNSARNWHMKNNRRFFSAFTANECILNVVSHETIRSER